MEAMREKWTDGRLDDMNERISEGFNRLDHELRDVRAEIRALRTDIGAEFGSVRSEIGSEFGSVRSENDSLRAEMNSRFDAMQRLILQVGAGMFGTMALGFIGIILSQH
jgi:hypothetical protein